MTPITCKIKFISEMSYAQVRPLADTHSKKKFVINFDEFENRKNYLLMAQLKRKMFDLRKFPYSCNS